jgi:hypothetical protein
MKECVSSRKVRKERDMLTNFFSKRCIRVLTIFLALLCTSGTLVAADWTKKIGNYTVSCSVQEINRNALGQPTQFTAVFSFECTPNNFATLTYNFKGVNLSLSFMSYALDSEASLSCIDKKECIAWFLDPYYDNNWISFSKKTITNYDICATIEEANVLRVNWNRASRLKCK